MAYFDCIVGGSGKGNTLVVTCADDLAGATITCTNGTKTYTKTCPSTSPYEVTFYGLTAGTWTVSATVSGNTYTTTVVVVDCAALLGGFSWRTWVDTAKFLDSSDYNSLDEVLADEEAVRELCLEHNCVDYLADIATASEDVETIINNDLFAKWANNSDYALDFLGANTVIKALMDEADKYGYGEWIITDDTTTPPTWGPKGNVPVMTSNSAPYGEVVKTEESQTSGYELWHVFDGNQSTSGIAQITQSVDVRFGYHFTNPIDVRKVHLKVRSDLVSRLTQFKVMYSDDNSTYYDASDWVIGTGVTDYDVDITSVGYHLYWCVLIYRANSANYPIAFTSLQFYGRELSVSVPTMTSNTTPYGEVGGNRHESTSSLDLYGAFNQSTSNYTELQSGGKIYYKFNKPTVIKKVGIYTYSGSVYYVNNMQLVGSNDNGATWQNIGTAKTPISQPAIQYFDYADNKEPFSIIGISVNAQSSNNPAITILQFYGKDYSEKEFEEGATKKWLYDHGVELEAFENLGSGAIIRESSQIGYNKTVTGDNGIITVNAVDLTDYDLVRAKVGSVITADGHEIAVTGYTAYKVFTTNDMPNTYGFSIFSINESKKIIVTPNASAALGKFTISELWLE